MFSFTLHWILLCFQSTRLTVRPKLLGKTRQQRLLLQLRKMVRETVPKRSLAFPLLCIINLALFIRWQQQQQQQTNKQTTTTTTTAAEAAAATTTTTKKKRETKHTRGFESRQARREIFFFQGQLAVLTLISVSVPPPCYRSSMQKIPVILPKVQVAGYS